MVLDLMAKNKEGPKFTNFNLEAIFIVVISDLKKDKGTKYQNFG